MTLLELTVVIIVLLSLVTILLIGAQGWKDGADRSACVLNIRNAQNATRAYQNTRAVPGGAEFNSFTEIFGPDKFFSNAPLCPSGGFYEHIDHMPFVGELAMKCDLADSRDHIPPNSYDW